MHEIEYFFIKQTKMRKAIFIKLFSALFTVTLFASPYHHITSPAYIMHNNVLKLLPFKRYVIMAANTALGDQ